MHETPIKYETWYCTARGEYVTSYKMFDPDRGQDVWIDVDEDAPFRGHEF